MSLLNLPEAQHAAATATAMTIAMVGVAAGVDAIMISKYSRDYSISMYTFLRILEWDAQNPWIIYALRVFIFCKFQFGRETFFVW